MGNVTTVGRMMFEDVVPEEHRQGMEGDIGSGQLKDVLQSIAEKDPGAYRRISHDILQLGERGARETNTSFTLADLAPPIDKSKMFDEVARKERAIMSDPKLTADQRQEKLVRIYGEMSGQTADKAYEAALAKGSGLAKMVAAGARGNKGQLNSNIGADWLVSDSKGRPVPIPIKRNYAEGLSPAEYFAGAYGTRLGLTATKFAVQDSGFFAKQLSSAAGDLIVSKDEDEADEGYPVLTADKDNIGAVLAAPTKGYARGTVITPKVLKDLQDGGPERIAVMSPVSSNMPGGLAALSVGIREKNRLPGISENVGLSAASGLSEPVSQALLSTKHTAGVASAGGGSQVTGFPAINSLAQVPRTYPGAATLTEVDGQVREIREAPQGGQFVRVGDEEHYVPPNRAVVVKKGDVLEAGDALSEGVPNPSEIVRHKGIGAGRAYFVDAMMKTLKQNGTSANRRNVEVISRALINHVKITDPDQTGGHLADDVVEYSAFAKNYTPSASAKTLQPEKAVGMYLEKPAFHFTIGTRITPSMAKTLKEMGRGEVLASDEKPGFEPVMVRMMDNPAYKQDWMTHMGNSYVKRNLSRDIRGGGADSFTHGKDFAPGLAKGTEFGRAPGKRPGY